MKIKKTRTGHVQHSPRTVEAVIIDALNHGIEQPYPAIRQCIAEGGQHNLAKHRDTLASNTGKEVCAL